MALLDDKVPPDEAIDLWREGLTMALYVAVCLLAAVLAVPHGTAHAHAIGIVWGISLGLVLAHLFAFRVSSRLVASGRVRAEDLRSASAQLAGAAAVACVATIPVILAPESREVAWVEATMAVVIAGAGYAVARAGRAGRVRSMVYGLIVVALAGAIALAKNHLAGH
ncbi:hypothetical protein [Nocardioides sp. CER19]|uniref:hypothetical protein n=1 Tax=Nocardioides sp. CER19 TaxID=3038538 RepID=UPI00244D32F3|nr:hypothetical protein [Nocardioides sp. CER19]MDH2413856.1 hypothetical protein [Nocardioides sp. CER19]